MKHSLLSIIALFFSLCIYAQDVVKDSAGNYRQIRPDTTTGKTFTDYNNVVHPVYKSKTGKLYIIRTSPKTGNKYRYFFKLENE